MRQQSLPPGEKYHINVDANILPKCTAARPVPVHQQTQFKAELNKMLKLVVIKPVTEAIPWISSFVIVESNKDPARMKTNDAQTKSKLHVCLDPSNLNKAAREPYYYCTIKEVITELSNAKYFTIIDMQWGYWKVPLDEESSYLTTFNTPYGRFRFTRMTFGLNVAGDAFQP